MNRSARLIVSALVAATSVACGGPKPLAEGRRPGSERKAEAPANSSRAELSRAVRTLPRPGEFFAGVPASLRADAEALVARLSAGDRARLGEPQGEAAGQRPLLHLVAGGKSVDALFALATGQAATELLLVRRAAGHGDLGEVVVGARTLARNAALAWIEERWVELGAPSTFTAELGDRMAAVAAVLERRDLTVLAARAAAEASGSQERWLRVAEAASRVLDFPLAEQALGRAESARAERAVALGAARDRVEAARTVLRARGQKLGPEETVKVARAYARLERARDALPSLESHRSLREKHLSLAVAWAVARLGGTLCGGLPPAAPPELCAAAWQDAPEPAEISQVLARAWQSRAGRDAESVETYLGLEHVVPWIFSLLRESEDRAEDAGPRFAARLGSLAASVAEAAREFPSFQGLLLFVDTLSAGFQAATARAPQERVTLPPAIGDGLWQRAIELASRDGSRPTSQVAVLGVAAMLMQDRDPGPLVERLPQPVAAQYARGHALLRLWSAVAHRRPDGAETARAELVGNLPPEGDLGRSQTVLLLAEADALLRGRTEDYAILGRVAGQLLGDGVPGGLRLQAAIDQAGSLARKAEYGAAVAALNRGLAGTAEAKPDRDLVAVARAYLALLRTRSARGPDRAARLAEFEQAARPDPASLPAGARLWHDLWRTELDRMPRAVPNEAERARRMGTEAARVFAAGALPLGAVESNLSYSLERGLWPVLNIEMRLLAAEMPPGK